MELVSGGTAEKDFYSHAREGRDEGNLKLVRSINISTHTPARGVTASYADCRMLLQISTHTPARGVTDNISNMYSKRTNFYSHAREGRDADSQWTIAMHLQFLLTRPRGA